MKRRIYNKYALFDPRDEFGTLRRHKRQNAYSFYAPPQRNRFENGKGMWLAELQRYGLQPTIKVLEEMQVEETQRYLVGERERHWIRAFEQLGASLTNIRDTLADPRKPSNRDRGNSYDRKILANSLRGLGDSTGVPTLDQLRIRAGLRVNESADVADVSESSLRKMIRGDAVSSVLVYKVLRVLSERLGRELSISDVNRGDWLPCL